VKVITINMFQVKALITVVLFQQIFMALVKTIILKINI